MGDNETRAAIIAQLRENTGRSILDSGDAYGRGYERWQSVQDDAALTREGVTVHRDYATINTVEWLAARLEPAPLLDRVFRLWSLLHDPEENEPWLVTMKAFQARMIELGHSDAYYGRHEFADFTCNTYNHDSLLDETLQYCVIYWRDETYILLQTHNGCDVRGGYSSPRAYSISDYEGIYSLLDESFSISHEVTPPQDTELELGLESNATFHAYDYRNGEWSDYDGSYLTGENKPQIVAWDESGNPIPEEDTPWSGDFAFQCPECGARMGAYLY